MPTGNYEPVVAGPAQAATTQSGGLPADDTMVASPIMITSLPSIASTSDQFARQFYAGSTLPQRRSLPPAAVQTTVMQATTVDQQVTNNTTNVTTGALVVTQTDVTADRTEGTVYTNTDSGPRYVSGYFLTAGSGVGNVTCYCDTNDPPTTPVWSQESTATVEGGAAGFSMMVPPASNYQVTTAGDIHPAVIRWIEVLITLTT